MICCFFISNTITQMNNTNDIFLNDNIIKVKQNYTSRFEAIGHILYYSNLYKICHKKNYIKQIHLFNHNNLRDDSYENFCHSLHIVVSYE
jgi:hypothetical protein